MPQKQIKQFLEIEAEQIGREVGVVQRRSKLNGARFVQILVLGWLANPVASLNTLLQVAHNLGVEISTPALQQRITERMAVFLQELVGIALKRFNPISAELPPGGVIVRQSIWIGLFFVTCRWLQIPRVLNLPIAFLVALVFVVIEAFLRTREIRSERAE